MVNYYGVNSIVMEASSKEDQTYMKSMDKHDINQINGQSVQNLFELTTKRSDINFGDIPDSKGDIEKCKYYENTKKCLIVIAELHAKANIKDESVSVVNTAISNMLKFRPQFTRGFQMHHNFIMTTYNSLVLSIIDATTMLIRKYTDYMITSEPSYQNIQVVDKQRGDVSIKNLKNFNHSCDNGTMIQTLTYLLDAGHKELIGDVAIVTGTVIVATIAIMTIIRELIYFFYSSRVKISDYLKMQSDFLEMNSLAVKSSSRPPEERKAIAKKQEKMVSDMRRLSDKIMIDHVDTEDVVKKQIKDDSSVFSLGNIDKQISKNKIDGNELTIL